MATGPGTARVWGRMYWGEQPGARGRPLPPEPLPPATVILKGGGLEQRVAVKDDAGFDMRLPPGAYEVGVEVPATHRAVVRPGRLTIADAQAEHRLAVEVNWNCRLSGRVVDADGRPVVGVSVWLSSPDQRRRFRSFTFAISREDGTFTVGELDPGEQRVTIGEELAPPGRAGGPPGDAPIVRTLQVEPAQLIDLGTVTLPAGTAVTTVRGMVIDAAGTPVKGRDGFDRRNGSDRKPGPRDNGRRGALCPRRRAMPAIRRSGNPAGG